MTKYYTIYQITHIPSGKIYIGRHQTEDLNDGYMGSGKHLKRAQEKYGLDQFKKKYLHIYYHDHHMYKMEAELVTEEFCAREDTYNVQPGGFDGGWQHLNNGSDKHIQRTKNAAIKSNQNLLKRQNASERLTGKPSLFLGKTHTEESKKKNSLSNKNKVWITNGIKARKINKDDSIPEGWKRGRK